MIRVLSHLRGPRQALTEARRVLRPGGQLVVAAHGPGHLAATWRTLGRPASGQGPDAPLRAALQAAGLSALRLDVRIPVQVRATQARELVQVSGLKIQVNDQRFPVEDTLHLTAYIARVS